MNPSGQVFLQIKSEINGETAHPIASQTPAGVSHASGCFKPSAKQFEIMLSNSEWSMLLLTSGISKNASAII